MYPSRRLQPYKPAGTFDLQSMGLQLLTFGEIDDPKMRHFNPSIAWHQGKLKIALRSCNFAVERHGKWYLRDGGAYSKTDVFYGDLDPDSLQITKLQKLTLSKNSPTVTLVAGLEDVRLFSRKDGLYAIGFECDRLTRSLHNKSATLAIYKVNGDELTYVESLTKPYPELVEKNWQPTDVATDEFDYTYSPTQVWKSGKVIGEEYVGGIHGGSQLLSQKDGTFLSLVHKKVADKRFGNAYDKYIYFTYLARHNSKGVITHLTPPFTFGTHENIEFASGMIEHDGQFIMTLGIRDAKFGIAKIEAGKLIDKLKNVVKL